MDEPLAIEAVRRQVRELVDGSLEIKLHVSPIHKAEFHRLFPEIDTMVAIAPLRLNTFEPAPQATETAAQKTAATEARHEKKGPLTLSQWTALRCREEQFQHFLQAEYGRDWNAVEPPYKNFELHAAEVVRHLCEVESRAELDTDPEAAKRMHKLRVLYTQWLEAR